MNEKQPVPVSADYICSAFRRVPESLIEEPEVCEFCQEYRDGLCLRGEARDV